MVTIKNFSEDLERDLERLTAEVEKREVFKEKNISEKEVVKNLVKEVFDEKKQEKESKPDLITEKKNEVLAKEKLDLLPSYLKEEKWEDKKIKIVIEQLISLVFEKGISRGITEAKKMPPFVQDAFHDALADKILPFLREKGLLNKLK